MRTQQQRVGKPPKADYKTQPIGLVCQGGITQSFIGKFTGMMDRLGPVKASGIRVASRVSNSLRAGTPTDDYSDLDVCGMIVVAAPVDGFPILLDELLAAEIHWDEKVLLLLDSALDCEELSMFTKRHALVATLDLIEGSQEMRFIVQSDSRTVKRLRALLDGSKARLIEIEWGTKSLYSAGITFANSLATPLMAASVECLMAAGLELPQAQNITDMVLNRTQRAFMKAGRRGWTGPLASKNSGAILKQWKSLQKKNPILADYFIETATLSLEYFRQDAKFIAELAQVPRRYSGRVMKISSSSIKGH